VAKLRFFAMPVSLIPATRRSFLQAGAAAVLSPRAFNAVAAEAAPWFAMLADTHIEADPAKTARDINMADNLRTVVAEILAEPTLPEFAFVNGDCAYNTGEKGDYETFRALVQPLLDAGVPIYLTMGNHDDRGPFYELFPEAKAGPGNKIARHVSVVESAQANWIFIDTLKEVNKVTGEVGAAQRQWISAAVDRHSSDGKPAIVVGHHYAQSMPEGSTATVSGLADTAEFMDLLRSKSQVKAYIFGHSHSYGFKEDRGGIHLVNQPPVGYLFNPELPNGWLRGQLTAGSMTIELRALDKKHAQHGVAKTLAWR